MIDPYLSDSVYKTNAQKFRRIPIKEALFSIKPERKMAEVRIFAIQLNA